ncbi:MAG: hypothetical protein HRU35_06665 [Rickettsiaceae bacterium]|nr:hypothetical protein [Rickettsiaceae bacterium]
MLELHNSDEGLKNEINTYLLNKSTNKPTIQPKKSDLSVNATKEIDKDYEVVDPYKMINYNDLEEYLNDKNSTIKQEDLNEGVVKNLILDSLAKSPKLANKLGLQEQVKLLKKIDPDYKLDFKKLKTEYLQLNDGEKKAFINKINNINNKKKYNIDFDTLEAYLNYENFQEKSSLQNIGLEKEEVNSLMLDALASGLDDNPKLKQILDNSFTVKQLEFDVDKFKEKYQSLGNKDKQSFLDKIKTRVFVGDKEEKQAQVSSSQDSLKAKNEEQTSLDLDIEFDLHDVKPNDPDDKSLVDENVAIYSNSDEIIEQVYSKLKKYKEHEFQELQDKRDAVLEIQNNINTYEGQELEEYLGKLDLGNIKDARKEIKAEIDEIEQEIEMYNASPVQDDVRLKKLNAKITKAEKAQKEAEKLKTFKKHAKLEQEENLDNIVKKNRPQNILGLDEYQFIKEFTDKSISKIYKEKHESKNENWQNNSKEYCEKLLDELTKKYQNHIGESTLTAITSAIKDDMDLYIDKVGSNKMLYGERTKHEFQGKALKKMEAGLKKTEIVLKKLGKSCEMVGLKKLGNFCGHLGSLCEKQYKKEFIKDLVHGVVDKKQLANIITLENKKQNRTYNAVNKDKINKSSRSWGK